MNRVLFKFLRCNSEQRRFCHTLLEQYDAPPAIDPANEETDEYQVRFDEILLRECVKIFIICSPPIGVIFLS